MKSGNIFKRNLTVVLKEEGIRNAYSNVNPESFFTKEADHIEGSLLNYHGWQKNLWKIRRTFSAPSNKWNNDLNSFFKLINSYRDLPYEINQWANVFRWEKETLPFLRTSEFYGKKDIQHADEEDARRRTMKMLEVYKEVVEGVLVKSLRRSKKNSVRAFRRRGRHLLHRSNDERRKSRSRELLIYGNKIRRKRLTSNI